MSKVLVLAGPREVAYEEAPDAPLAPDEVRIRTLFSGISAGTELAQYRGTSPFLHKRWDADARLFVAGDETSLSYPVRSLGYEEVGEVIEVGEAVTDIPLGARIFGTWNHRTTYSAPAEYARLRLMPAGLDPRCGIFSHLGAIALNGVHDGRVRIGETVAVFGLGALGQIVAQAARQSGATVIGIDLHEARLQMARDLGAHVTLHAAQDCVAETIKDLTGGDSLASNIQLVYSNAALAAETARALCALG